jgi:predicted HAD superfamily phosphohydrolase
LDLREHLHGTEFEVERLSPLFDEEDRAKAAELVKKISTMPEIEVDVERRKLVSGSETVLFLNRVFWGTIKEKQNSFIEKIRDVSKEIKVMGGRRKLEIVKKLVKKYRIGRIIAIGDSISDYEMLGWVKGRGLAVSFNGNGYSLMQSNLAVVSDTAFSEAAVVVAYLSHGMEGVKKLVKMTDSRDWEGVRKLIGDGITEGVVNSETKYYWVGEENFRKVLQDSIRMREKLRGDAGKLG